MIQKYGKILQHVSDSKFTPRVSRNIDEYYTNK